MNDGGNLVSKASKFIKGLDKILSKSCIDFRERDIDAPQVMHEIFDDLRRLLAKASSADWREISIERHKEDLKTHILSQVLELAAHGRLGDRSDLPEGGASLPEP